MPQDADDQMIRPSLATSVDQAGSDLPWQFGLVATGEPPRLCGEVEEGRRRCATSCRP